MGDEDDEDTTCASVGDTSKAILGVLNNDRPLYRKGIADKGYRLTP